MRSPTTPSPPEQKENVTVTTVFVNFLMFNDLFALTVGIFANALLILAIKLTKKRQGATFMKLIYIAAIFDFFFAIEEMITQHQLHVKDGVIYILAHGVERMMPDNFYPLCLLPHAFFTLHGLFILAGLYHFRHRLMTNAQASQWILVRDLATTVGMALTAAAAMVYGVEQGRRAKGTKFYYDKLKDEWFGPYGQKYFVYAADLQFSGVKVYFVAGLTVASTCVFLIFFYAYKSWRFVNPNEHASSAKTKAMQAQFTKAILIQTINAFVFAFFPVGLFTMLALFKLNGEFIGILVMAVVSWLPAANGAITIYVVKDFRVFVLGLVGLVNIKKLTSTVSVVGSSTVHKPVSKTTVRHSSTIPAVA